MKNISTFLLFLISFTAFSQVKVGENPNTINPSAVLEAESTNKGFLPPRMTTAQRDAIQNPVLGLQIYNTITNCMEYYRPTGWYSMCPRLATLTTVIASSITGVSASSGGQITDDGGATITSRGVCWSITPNPTLSNSFTSDGIGLGTFNSVINSLQNGTTYYVRAYATNSVGTAYGNEIVFTTLNKPTLSTSSVTLVYGKSATSGGNVTSDGGAAVTSRGLCWSTTQNPTIANSVINSGTGIGSFSLIMSGLNYSTTYYVRAFATNSVGTAYGNQVSFTTTAGTVVSFTTVGSSSWTVPAGVNSAEVLVVAGGGGGGGVIGGGGGAGGLIYNANYVLSNSSAVNITVGSGGEGGRGWDTNQQNGKPGGNSIFDNLIAFGGGGGRHHGGNTTTTLMNGGSGGGGAGIGSQINSGGIATQGQGNNGGSGASENGGGGGGSASVGANYQANITAGNGGGGSNYSAQFGTQFGVNGWFAGGGGGGVRQGFGTAGNGGNGGGGNGSSVDLTKLAQDGSPNTGGGGGGAGHNGSSLCNSCGGTVVAGNGGSGIVLIKY